MSTATFSPKNFTWHAPGELRACSPFNLTWDYTGDDTTVALNFSSVQVPHPSTSLHVTPTNTVDGSVPPSTTSTMGGFSLGGINASAEVQVTVASSVPASALHFSMPQLLVPGGWYMLWAESPAQDVLARSGLILVSNGTDTSCLGGSNATSTSSAAASNNTTNDSSAAILSSGGASATSTPPNNALSSRPSRLRWRSVAVGTLLLLAASC